MKKGDIVELEIESYAFEGKGIARINKSELNHVSNSINKKYVIFVPHAYPGDIVRAKILKLKKSYGEAKIEEIIKPAKGRIEPRCKYFGVCGGCKQQDLDYSLQLKYKEEQVIDAFNRLGGFENYIMESILASENVFFYRNKMEFSFSEKRWLTPNEIQSNENIDSYFALGLHIPRMFDKVLDIDECFLQSDESNKILNLTRAFFKSRKTSIYSTKTHTGYLRNLVIRNSAHTKDLMINLVTSEENDKLMREYTDTIKREIPEITTIINNINLKKSQVAVGDYEKVYFGDSFIFDRIGKYTYRISANSFFQTNTFQAEKLYGVAVNFAEFSGSEIVYDLYSGAGTITIFISEYVKKVFGFESVESAVKDAKINCELNHVNNTEFILADLNKSFLPKVYDLKIEQPDIIIADPPRSGMNPKTINDILKLAPSKIVYISCNPTTQARDIRLLSEGGYKLARIKPVDMFPQTYHIENVALLVK